MQGVGSWPRRRAALALALGAALAAGPAVAWRARAALAQVAEPPGLSLQVPAELRVGEHARVVLEARLPAGTAQPLLLTPFREGAALEIVKGRLLRSDALDGAQNPLRFELPVLALAPGAAVIGARLLAYVCQERCRALELETRANLVVLPR